MNEASKKIKLQIDGLKIDFSTAKELAATLARSVLREILLVSWLDGVTGRYFPQVECCGEDKPSWQIYAESRGGELFIEVEPGGYKFIFADVG